MSVSLRRFALFFRCFDVLHNIFKVETVKEKNQDEILHLNISNTETQLCEKKKNKMF